MEKLQPPETRVACGTAWDAQSGGAARADGAAAGRVCPVDPAAPGLRGRADNGAAASQEVPGSARAPARLRGESRSPRQLVQQTPKQRVALYFDELLADTLPYEK